MRMTRPIILTGLLGLFAASNAEAQGIQIRGQLFGRPIQLNFQPGYQPGYYGSGLQPGLQPGIHRGHQHQPGILGGYQPGFQPGIHGGYQPGFQPGFQGGHQPGFAPGVQPGFGFQPGFGVPLRDKDLERHVERSIKSAFGRIIDDVDVDADVKDGKIEIEVEVDDVPPAAVYHQLHAFVFGMPELQGLRIKFEVDD